MNYSDLFLFGLIALCDILSIANGKIINCYYGTWAHYRPGEGSFKAENIDPNLCTHLSYSFYGIDSHSGEIRTLDAWLTDNSGIGQVDQVMKLKRKNPNFKVTLVVGGWNECETDKYSRMAASPQMRKNFVKSAVSLIQQHGFDGLDLDWEYPVVRAGSPADKSNFVTLLSEIKAALAPLGKELGIAVGAGAATASAAYDIPGIARNVDFINVMTYDFATYGSGVVGLNAPLTGQQDNNVKYAIQYWLAQGAPASKLVLGLAFYGRTFKLADPQNYNIGAKSVGPLSGGPMTSEAGFLGYHEICQIKNSYSYEWLSKNSVPILHRDTDYISYDNVKSLELKVDFSNSLNLAGVMIWSIETDDFHNKCGDGKFPLLQAVNKRVGNPKGPSLAKKEHNKSSAPKTLMKKPQVIPKTTEAKSGNCRDGIYLHPHHCGMYQQCANNIMYEKYCPAGLHFDGQVCNYPEMVNCKL